MVKFGSAMATDVRVVSDNAAVVTIPEKYALDPNPVTVHVVVDGVEQPPLTFEYLVPQPAPVITSTSTDRNPFNFTVNAVGENFTNPSGRVPTQAYLVGRVLLVGQVTDATATTLQAQFTPVPAGDYKFVVGFSDGASAEASITAS